jgi:hypothetical protein
MVYVYESPMNEVEKQFSESQIHVDLADDADEQGALAP